MLRGDSAANARRTPAHPQSAPHRVNAPFVLYPPAPHCSELRNSALSMINGCKFMRFVTLGTLGRREWK